MKYVTVTISEINKNSILRAGYWIRKKNVQNNTKMKVQGKKDRSKHSD